MDIYAKMGIKRRLEIAKQILNTEADFFPVVMPCGLRHSRKGKDKVMDKDILKSITCFLKQVF